MAVEGTESSVAVPMTDRLIVVIPQAAAKAEFKQLFDHTYRSPPQCPRVFALTRSQGGMRGGDRDYEGVPISRARVLTRGCFEPPLLTCLVRQVQFAGCTKTGAFSA